MIGTQAGTVETNWKSRYLDALDAHECFQGETARRLGDLGALIARVSRVLPEPEATLLSGRLAALGEAVRQHPLEPRSSRELGAIQAQIVDAIEAREREREALLGALREAADRLQGLGAGADFKRRLRHFRSTLSSREPAPVSALVAALCQMHAAVNDVPVTASAPPRVLHADAASPALSGPALDWDAVRQVLRTLLAGVDLPQPVREQAERIAALVDGTLDDASLLAILEALRELFNDALGAIQCEFRGFLDSVDRRLDMLLDAIGQARADGDATRALERGMAQSMQAELAAMRSEAAGATELTQLQQSIDGHLQRLVSSVHEFSRAGEALGEGRDARLDAMAKRLQAMEAQSRAARRQLEVQRRLALTDPLTGLANRLAFDQRLAEELARAGPDAPALALALADVDHFKRVNDDFGHQAGDRALVLLAGILRKHLRAADFCARYGGEEFVLLLPATAQQGALQVVEQMRAFVASCGFSYKARPVSLTMSFGVTAWCPGDTAGALVARADAALYAAKGAGRNRVRCA